MSRELFQVEGDKKRVRESGTTKGGGRERGWLDDKRGDRKEGSVGEERIRDSTELGCERQPCNGTIGKKEMAAGAGGG